MKILITGAAGFIGYHLTKRLAGENVEIVGLDNLNDYYSVNLKYARLNQLGIENSGFHSTDALINSHEHDNFSYIKCDLSETGKVLSLFEEEQFDIVINLAAQAGVRYSLENPHAYTSSNVEGFLNILEGCRRNDISHLIYASSSSVYGLNSNMPFEVSDRTDAPVSLYAATKKSNELMAHCYSHLYGIPCTGLRFFTVYGPLGRPDMAYFKFANLINNGEPIDVYNNGKMARDFTYIDDITESISRLVSKVSVPGRNKPAANSISQNGREKNKKTPCRIFNIGNGSPVNLLDFIEILEDHLGKKSKKNMMPMQPGDVETTWADVTSLFDYIQYKPVVGLDEGLKNFTDWYKNYYGIYTYQHQKEEFKSGQAI